VDSVSRTIRFKSDDIAFIAEFLEKNPLFDFSSLTRTALMQFIKNPSVQITAVNPSKTRTHSRRKEH
jgi:hypothetical protein